MTDWYAEVTKKKPTADGKNGGNVDWYDEVTKPQQSKPKVIQDKTDYSKLAREYGPVQAGAIATGKGFYNIGRGLGLIEPADDVEKQAMAALEKQNPISTTVGQAVGESAPFVPFGVAAGNIPGTIARVATGSALGGLEGGIVAKGNGGNPLAGTAIGAITAGTADLVLPYLMRSSSALFRKLTGKSAPKSVITATGEPTPELASALTSAGLSFDEVADDAFMSMARELGEDKAQLARKAFLESQGLRPTRAQITRDITDFQTQQELAKRTGRVSNALADQDAVIANKFSDAVRGTGGDAVTETNTIIDHVVSKSENLTNQISNLYKQAKEIAPGEKNVRLSSLTDLLRRYSPSDNKTGGTVSSIVGELQHRGVLGKNFQLKGKIDVNTAEQIRQIINTHHDPKNGFNQIVLGELRDAIDDDVFKASGGDIYRQARAAKYNYEQGLKRARVNKFDTRTANLVRDIQENKINPDTFIDDVVFSKKWRGEDLSQLKNYIDDPKVWDDLRAQALDGIRKRAMTGAEDANGYMQVTRASLERALKPLENSKLGILFNSQERKFLSDLRRVTKLREPVRGTALGKGPTAQAVLSLEKRLSNLPVIGSIIEAINIDSQGRLMVKPRAEITYKPIHGAAAGAVSSATIPATQVDRKE